MERSKGVGDGVVVFDIEADLDAFDDEGAEAVGLRGARDHAGLKAAAFVFMKPGAMAPYR